MKRFEVHITYTSVFLAALSALSGIKPTIQVKQYRWRWRARLECWFVNTSPPFMGSMASATWRPILRVVPATTKEAA